MKWGVGLLRPGKILWSETNYSKMTTQTATSELGSPMPEGTVTMPESKEPPASDAPEPPSSHPPYTTAWMWVMCVVGLDYLSSLAYQPSVAFSAAGILAPLVTVVVVVVTFLLAVPLYCYLAGRSPRGQGSAGMLEKLISGWRGKFLVVTLLGFAATDLVFTRTFSAADAAEHLLHSPFDPWKRTLTDAAKAGDDAKAELPPEVASVVGHNDSKRLIVTFAILLAGSITSLWCRKGVIRGLVRFSVFTVGIYLVLTAIIVGSGIAFLVDHPSVMETWWQKIGEQTADPAAAPHSFASWIPLFLAAAVLFPKLALGLSGYELALTGMPLIRGEATDDPDRPMVRIRRTRYMLVTLAGLMAIYLLSTTFVSTLLIPPEAFRTNGLAENRALAYLAHGGAIELEGEISPLFGQWFGAAYDLTTVVVLTLAGVTVLIATRELIPPYLCRLGMEWEWARRVGVMMYLFTGLKIAVTYIYKADVDAQRGAYLTGVLALFTVACFTGVVDVWQRRATKGSWRLLLLLPLFLVGFAAFGVSFASVVWNQPGGLVLALMFVTLLLGTSMVTRFFRSTELRVEGFTFADELSKEMWDDLIRNDYPMLVPSRPGGECLINKESEIRKLHRIPNHLALVFIHAELGDASDFYQRPMIRAQRENGRVVVYITRCASLSHTIAAAALEISRCGVVPEIHFGWSSENPLTANLSFVLFGHGNVPWMVYTLIRAADMPEEKKPRVMVG